MKKTRFATMLLAMVMLFSMTSMVTTASAIHIVDEEARIYVDGERVRNVDAYVDEDGDIRVYDLEDLYEVLPELEDEDIAVLPDDDGYVLENFLDYLEYSYSITGNRLYINSEPISWDDDDDVIDISDWDDEVIDISDLIEEKQIQLYINGMAVETNDVYLSQEKGVYIVGFEDVFKIFPEETKNMYLPFNSTQETLLEDWCNRFGYTMNRMREHVFINNDGNTPVELRVDGIRVEFPDQQPVIVPPGRTMIPVAMVAETLGWSVDWDAQNQRVIIMKGNNTMILWFGYDTYWINGTYHEMDVKVYTERDRTMVPIAFIAEAFNQKLSFWMEDGVFIVDLST